jgi:hypothetical protein
MTEAEWLACTDPEAMLLFLRGRVSDRKLRLFACACCRRIRELLPDEQSRSALDTAERFADGLASPEKLRAARDAAYRSYVEFPDHDEAGEFRGWESASAAVAGACWTGTESREMGLFDTVNNAYGLGCLSTGRRDGVEIELQRQCRSLRDIFGNPFRPVSLDPAWLTPQVLDLAQSIYDERAFDRMPRLADALETSGCDNAEILNHCRGPGPHVRGCWVIDLVLGKS